jgi:hypothetical protein
LELIFADKSQFGNPYVLQSGGPGGGDFVGLRDGKEYWVYVVEDPEEEEKDRERMKEVVKKLSEEIAMAAKGGERVWGSLSGGGGDGVVLVH